MFDRRMPSGNAYLLSAYTTWNNTTRTRGLCFHHTQCTIPALVTGMPWTSRQLRRLYCSWASLSSLSALFAVSNDATRCSSLRTLSFFRPLSRAQESYSSRFTSFMRPLLIIVFANVSKNDGLANSFLTIASLTTLMMIDVHDISVIFNETEHGSPHLAILKVERHWGVMCSLLSLRVQVCLRDKQIRNLLIEKQFEDINGAHIIW